MTKGVFENLERIEREGQEVTQDMEGKKAPGGEPPSVDSHPQEAGPAPITASEWEREQYAGVRITYQDEKGLRTRDCMTFQDYSDTRARMVFPVLAEDAIIPEPPAITAEDWQARQYVRVEITAGAGLAPAASMVYFDGQAPKDKTNMITAYSYDHYRRAIDYIHAQPAGMNRIMQQAATSSAITQATAREVLEGIDTDTLEIGGFPLLSETLRLRRHDSMILAAPPGGGKTCIALNILHGIMKKYPCIYFDMENGEGELLQRLVSCHSGILTHDMANYQAGGAIRERIDRALSEMLEGTRLQIVSDVYEVEQVQSIIERATAGREQKTVVFIDHGLLLSTSEVKGGAQDYEKFTRISRQLRRIARACNVIIVIMLQLNRDALKAMKEGERPTLEALKSTGAWAEDGTKVCFLWKKEGENYCITTEKNRGGKGHGEDFDIQLTAPAWSVQKITEAEGQARALSSVTLPEVQKEKPDNKYIEEQAAFAEAWERASQKKNPPQLADVAEALSTKKKRYTYKNVRDMAIEFRTYKINASEYSNQGTPKYKPTDTIEKLTDPEDFKNVPPEFLK